MTPNAFERALPAQSWQRCAGFRRRAGREGEAIDGLASPKPNGLEGSLPLRLKRVECVCAIKAKRCRTRIAAVSVLGSVRSGATRRRNKSCHCAERAPDYEEITLDVSSRLRRTQHQGTSVSLEYRHAD